MKWTKFTLKTTTEAVDLISSMLDEIGIEGIEIEDNVPLSDADTKGMFIDILPELPPDDGTAQVSFYVEDLSNLENIIHQVNAGLDEIAEFVNVGERSLSVSEKVREAPRQLYLRPEPQSWLMPSSFWATRMCMAAPA